MAKSESQISEKEWERWVDPFNATQRVKEAGLPDDERAIGWLSARLSLGELRGAGYLCRDGDEVWHLVVMSVETWRHIDLIPWKDDFWISGTYFPKIPDDDFGLSTIRYASMEARHHTLKRYEYGLYKVRFEPHLINEFCSSTPSTSNGPTAGKIDKGRRGAKRKDWWDQLWIEMIRRIKSQALKPKNQASLQTELEDYVRDELGIEVGDSTLKPMAANLFKYLQEISGEIGENSKS